MYTDPLGASKDNPNGPNGLAPGTKVGEIKAFQGTYALWNGNQWSNTCPPGIDQSSSPEITMWAFIGEAIRQTLKGLAVTVPEISVSAELAIAIPIMVLAPTSTSEDDVMHTGQVNANIIHRATAQEKVRSTSSNKTFAQDNTKPVSTPQSDPTDDDPLVAPPIDYVIKKLYRRGAFTAQTFTPKPGDADFTRYGGNGLSTYTFPNAPNGGAVQVLDENLIKSLGFITQPDLFNPDHVFIRTVDGNRFIQWTQTFQFVENSQLSPFDLDPRIDILTRRLAESRIGELRYPRKK